MMVMRNWRMMEKVGIDSMVGGEGRRNSCPSRCVFVSLDAWPDDYLRVAL